MTSAQDLTIAAVLMFVGALALVGFIVGFIHAWRQRHHRTGSATLHTRMAHVGHHRPTTVVPYEEEEEEPTRGLPLSPLEHQRLGIHGGSHYIRPPQPDAANVEATKWAIYQRATPVKAVAHIDARRRAASGGWNRVSDYLKAVVR